MRAASVKPVGRAHRHLAAVSSFGWLLAPRRDLRQTWSKVLRTERMRTAHRHSRVQQQSGGPAMAYVASWQNISAKVREVVGRITFAGLTLVLLAAHADSEARAAGASFSDFPFLIACEAADVAQQAYYLSRIDRERVATYQTHAEPACQITVTTQARQGG